MNDSFRVCRGQRVRNLTTQIEQYAERQRVATDVLPEGLPLEQFQDNETLALMFADFINRADVGMVECGRGTSFSTEPFKCLRISASSSGKNFNATKRPSSVFSAL